jgi:hypothetical protein
MLLTGTQTADRVSVTDRDTADSLSVTDGDTDSPSLLSVCRKVSQLLHL